MKSELQLTQADLSVEIDREAVKLVERGVPMFVAVTRAREIVRARRRAKHKEQK